MVAVRDLVHVLQEFDLHYFMADMPRGRDEKGMT